MHVLWRLRNFCFRARTVVPARRISSSNENGGQAKNFLGFDRGIHAQLGRSKSISISALRQDEEAQVEVAETIMW